MRLPTVLVCILWVILSAGVAFGAPAVTSPTPGTKLAGTTVTFSWDADGYTYFTFYAADHIAPYQSDTITDTSITISGIPNDGSPVFVKLSYWNGTAWETINYYYQASGSGAKLPSIQFPSPGSELTSPSHTFQWDFGDYKVDTWMSFILNLGSTPLAADIYQGELTGNNTVTVRNLPQDNSSLYTTLWYWDGLEFKNVASTFFSKKFPWTMFLPAITTRHECSLDYLGLCADKASCENAGAYWWAKECHESMSNSQALMTQLAGYFHFTYSMYGIDWNEYYYFDINTLKETESQSGWFRISGTDDYGNKVTVSDHLYSDYHFWNRGFPNSDEYFRFSWDSPSTIKGSFYWVPKGGHSADGIRTQLKGTHSRTPYPR